MVNWWTSGLRRQSGCCNISPRRRLGWPVKLWLASIMAAPGFRKWGWDIDVLEVKFRVPNIDEPTVSRNWNPMCRGLGDGGKTHGTRVTPSIVSILRSWRIKNVSGISFTPNLWYLIDSTFLYSFYNLVFFPGFQTKTGDVCLLFLKQKKKLCFWMNVLHNRSSGWCYDMMQYPAFGLKFFNVLKDLLLSHGMY